MKKTDNERFYDAEIAPKLAELATQCGERGMPFIAVVEYNPDERGETRFMTENPGLAMMMLSHCAKSGVNIDQYIFGLLRYCKEQGIDTSSSLVAMRINNWGKEV